MDKVCQQCQFQFEVTYEDRDFYSRVSPVFSGQKCLIPEPIYCFSCREQRRMAWRNERFLFNRRCDKTGENLVSGFPPGTEFPVWRNPEWWGSEHDALQYGRDFDFSLPVVDQFKALQKVVPVLSSFKYADDRLINSEYTNCSGDLKDCYLVFDTGASERCYYSMGLMDCYDSMDCFFSMYLTGCYECIDCMNSRNLFFSQSCKECHDSWYLYDCRGIKDSIACVGLRQKQYCILNRQYSKEEYERLKSEILVHGQLRADIEKAFDQLSMVVPRKFYQGDNIESSTGDSLWSVKNCKSCFNIEDSEDCKYCTHFMRGRDCMDFFAWGEAELCYDVSGGGDGMYGCAFTANSFGCRNSFYLQMTVYSQNCFLCVGLKHGEYCILNKQYSKEEYEDLVPRIIEKMKEEGLWGRLLPLSLSPFCYNYSVAQEWQPLEKDEALRLGFRWSDYVVPEVSREGTNVMECEVSGKAFRFIKQELEFYKRNGLNPPRRHPDERHRMRLLKVNPRCLWDRNCGKCGVEIQTSYSPDRLEKVYCEQCYLLEAY